MELSRVESSSRVEGAAGTMMRPLPFDSNLGCLVEMLAAVELVAAVAPKDVPPAPPEMIVS
ncbi:MAG: hypothetical protein QWI73_06520 [Alphaproteobacteria bacterium]|nr:hypothetical protein [Alphaproteobacteria bacterium]